MALIIRLSDCILRKGMTAAKNYLSEEELNLLNLIVDQCLFFPNAQAKQKRGMTGDDRTECQEYRQACQVQETAGVDPFAAAMSKHALSGQQTTSPLVPLGSLRSTLNTRQHRPAPCVRGPHRAWRADNRN
ncbi:MAG: hypothetical protein IPN78_15510 [Candidatus Accumulibacter sp.]|nr:hypothetical protein [Candidatus Accumulibacter propinquus]